MNSENNSIKIVNVYAFSKHMGELYSLGVPNSVVIRTNITGFRNPVKPNSMTFIEWLTDSLYNGKPISLFSDFFTSTLDTRTASRAMIRLIESPLTGLYNIGSRNSVSKLDFAKTFAQKSEIDLNWHSISSVKSLTPRRANTLGLDVSKFQAAFPDFELPTHDEVAVNLLNWLNELKESNS